MRRPALLLAALLLGAAPAGAQQEPGGRFQVTPYAGYLAFDGESALDPAPVGGLEVAYRLAGTLKVGFTVDYARTRVDGHKFPYAELNFGIDSTVLVAVHQPVSVLHAAALATLELPGRALAPYVAAGLGGATVFLDPQQADRPATVEDLVAQLGAGLVLRTGGALEARIDARDVVYTSFDREALNVVRPQNRNDRFPELNPPASPGEQTMHNLRFTLGLRYRPAVR